ncbi:MAG: hypothetical protein ABSB79_03750 [Syntrophales bacterium]
MTDPKKRNSDIVQSIMVGTNNFEEVIARIKQFAGRFTLLFKNDKDAFILHDALALREIYYCIRNNRIVCGSQPNLVVKYADPEIKPSNNPDLLEYYATHSRNSRWSPYCKWIGDETYYDGIKHLLPNHYLDINKREVFRYWPNEPIKRLHLDDAVSRSCAFLQGCIKAIMHRYPVMMAVTAGTDSRTLLAASKGMQDKIYYFINDHGLGHRHPDINVPKKIFAHIGVPFHIHEVPDFFDDEFCKIFLNNTFFANERLMSTIYNVYFKKCSERVNILGIGEIGRTRYGKEPRNLNGYRLIYKLGYKEGRYVIRQGERILSELQPVGRTFNINVMTLMYWEHTLGNWGATGNSESDIAIEEINPYDSHELYEIFLGVDHKYTQYNAPVLFEEMIRRMWPELLEWPINPPHSWRDKIAYSLKNTVIYSILKELKYEAYYLRYRFKEEL